MPNPTVALVLVAHSRALADGVVELAGQMAPDVVLVAAGGDGAGGLGTSFDRVSSVLGEALEAAADVVVLYDLGSALLTTETALEFLDPDVAGRIEVVDAPFVEGAVAAAVTAQSGGDRAAVAASAHLALTTQAGSPTRTDAVTGSATLRNSLGLHARPAAELARALARFDAQVTLGRAGEEPVEVASVLAVMALGARGGETLAVAATGADATSALSATVQLIESGFGEA